MLTREQKLAVIDIVREVSQNEIVPRFRKLTDDAIATKSGFDDLVTEADVAAEKELTKRFKQLIPSALVIGEEAVAEDETVLNQIDSDGVVFIIDPVDGTWNYANGLPTFGVIIAVMYRGETIFGLLYDPLNDDWVEASLGEGAWFVRAEGASQRMQIPSTPADPRLAGIFSPFLFKDPSQRARAGIQQTQYARVIGLRCCCHEYRTMLQGNMDFFISPKPNVWDHAAGLLAYQEAGGIVRMIDGSSYRPSVRQGVIIAGCNDSVVTKIAQDFSKVVE